jgi:hypothetical protein
MLGSHMMEEFSIPLTAKEDVPFLTRDEIEEKAASVRRQHEVTTLPIDRVIIANRLGIKVHNAKFCDDHIVGMMAGN